MKNVVFVKDKVCNLRHLCTGTGGNNLNFQDVVKENKRMLESRDYVTNHFGCLNINVPFHVSVESLDPQFYPNMNQVILRLFYASDKPGELERLADISNKYEVNVNKTENSEVFQVEGTSGEPKIPLLCHLQIPLKFSKQLNYYVDYIDYCSSTCSIAVTH